MDPRTLCELFDQIADQHAAEVAYRHKSGGRWHDVTWAEQREAVGRVARSLIALGVAHGDKVAILSSTRLEWVQCDSAIVQIGAVSVGIYHSCLAGDCAYIVEHSDARVLFVENDAQLAKILELREKLPALECIVLFEGPSQADRGILAWSEFLELGSQVSAEALQQRARAVEPADLAALVYTSGTTGQPKGVMISHANLLFTLRAAVRCLRAQPGETTLLFLPLAHVFARLIVYLCMRLALTISFAEDLGKVAENLKEVRPHFILSVPRMYEKIREKILDAAERAGGWRHRLFLWALAVGKQAARLQLEQRPLPPWLKLRRALADRLVLRKVREVFGGRMSWCVSGAAALNPHVGEFFLACGIRMTEGLGMTENTSLSNVNPPERIKLGTVGPVVPGLEMQLAPDGEVLFRGGNVMQGYYKDPQATREAIDDEGWLHSGDVGEIDADGYLTITDRKKDLIVTAGGKNIAPQKIEALLRESPFIGQAVAYGDGRKYVTALIVLDAEHLERWAANAGLGPLRPQELSAHPAVHELIEREVAACNRALASFESVKKFRILPRELTIATGELTATLKPKRKVIYAKYADLLDAMYRQGTAA